MAMGTEGRLHRRKGILQRLSVMIPVIKRNFIPYLGRDSLSIASVLGSKGVRRLAMDFGYDGRMIFAFVEWLSEDRGSWERFVDGGCWM